MVRLRENAPYLSFTRYITIRVDSGSPLPANRDADCGGGIYVKSYPEGRPPFSYFTWDETRVATSIFFFIPFPFLSVQVFIL